MLEVTTHPDETSLRDGAGFSPDKFEQFNRDGYVIACGLAGEELRERMLEATLVGLHGNIAPCEFEADLQYPGAPPSRTARGGDTIRRLQQAISRDPAFMQWVTQPALTARLRQLLGHDVVMPLAHHNCIMTKQPMFSSRTGWHQDVRYWSFERRELVSVWLALGSETQKNGCLRLIPGSHRMTFDSSRLDDLHFFRDDIPANETLIDEHIYAELDPGDALFFHARTLHSAGDNRTASPKFSVVFTFRPGDNLPLPGTRSASQPELILPRHPPGDDV